MRIRLNLYASLSRYQPSAAAGDPELAEVAEGATISELLGQLGVPADAVKVVFLNGVHAKPEAKLREGDRVGVFPPVAGG